MGLQTGRFHNDSSQAMAEVDGAPGHESSSKKEIGLSKSANQAQALRQINAETLDGTQTEAAEVDLAKQEFGDVQEQEMRETSYFRH